jgi:hypothetical protein
VVAAISFVVGLIFLPETKDRDIIHMQLVDRRAGAALLSDFMPRPPVLGIFCDDPGLGVGARLVTGRRR